MTSIDAKWLGMSLIPNGQQQVEHDLCCTGMSTNRLRTSLSLNGLPQADYITSMLHGRQRVEGNQITDINRIGWGRHSSLNGFPQAEDISPVLNGHRHFWNITSVLLRRSKLANQQLILLSIWKPYDWGYHVCVTSWTSTDSHTIYITDINSLGTQFTSQTATDWAHHLNHGHTGDTTDRLDTSLTPWADWKHHFYHGQTGNTT